MKKSTRFVNNRVTDKQLDKLWREVCLARDGCCRYTKEIHGVKLTRDEAVLQVHHVMKKSTHRLRWDLDNGITVTKGVHFSVAHSQKPTIENQFRSWALGRLPAVRRRNLELLERSRGTGGVDKFALKIFLEQKLKTFRGGVSFGSTTPGLHASRA